MHITAHSLHATAAGLRLTLGGSGGEVETNRTAWCIVSEQY